MLTEIFLSFCITSAIGAVLVCCRLLYKSKCKNFELCCLKIERDAQEENNADLIIDLSRRLSNGSNDKLPLQDKIVRYENIYKGDLPKSKSILDNKKVQDVSPSILEEGLSNISMT